MAQRIGGEMETNEPEDEQDLELDAMAKVYAALRPLDREAQGRVLEYVGKRLELFSPTTSSPATRAMNPNARPDRNAAESADVAGTRVENPKPEQSFNHDETTVELEGVSPVAQKWIRRNGLTEEQLSSLFSLGVDEIDLVASSVPGKSTKEKLRSVILLQGVASYLGTGAPRIDYEKLRQTVTHYAADPGKNFWTYMKSLTAEVAGSTSTGFALTTRGLSAATDLIKQITAKE
jgi:hypothetical protein